MNLDDPKLTAYALGELTGEERKAMETAVKNDTEAERIVNETAAFGDLLSRTFKKEEIITLKKSEREAMLAKAKTVRFPVRKIAGIAGLSTLAAALAILPFLPMMLDWKRGSGIASAPTFNSIREEHESFLSSTPEINSGVACFAPPRAELPTAPPQESTELPTDLSFLSASSTQHYSNSKPIDSIPTPSAQATPGGLTAEQASQVAKFTGNWAIPERPSDLRIGRAKRIDFDATVEDISINESYSSNTENSFLSVAQAPLSTFSIDVDTASYSNIRRFLNHGQRPPAAAVRIEEMINYFTYDYPEPKGTSPFSTTLEVAECPWQPEHRLVRIGLKGRNVPASKRPAANLVFLIDVSGSMATPDKLPLLKESLRLLVNQLGPKDRVAIVVYAGAAGMVLPPTGVDEKTTILNALDRLNAGGSTNGDQGIQLAYQTAETMKTPGSITRVILASDGDFNVGVTNRDDLTRLIEEKAKSDIFLTVLGFGTGNLKDATMEQLANRGNGHYAYIDSIREGRKVLVKQINGTLQTIAKDVKIQVEFNPAIVGSYRLIGYENRLLAKEDFNDDKKDAGEIGAGHTVTALYEVVPATLGTPGVDPLKYQSTPAPKKTSDEMLTLKLRYKEPEGKKSRFIEVPLKDAGRSWGQSSSDFRFAAAVAGFGMLLRGSPFVGNADWESVKELATEGKGEDPEGYRKEFLILVNLASNLW